MCVYLSIGNMAKYLCNIYAVFHHVAQVLLYNADMVKKVNVPTDKPLDAPKYEVIEYKGNPARLYPDGSIRNNSGHWLAVHPAGASITRENARELQASGVMKKRAVMMAAANREVPPELIAEFGAYAHVAERAQTLQRIASSPEAGKAAVMAHDALIRDTGMSEKQQEQTQQAQLSLTDQALLGLIQAITDRVKGDSE